MKPIKYVLEEIGIKASEEMLQQVKSHWHDTFELFRINNIRLTQAQFNKIITSEVIFSDFDMRILIDFDILDQHSIEILLKERTITCRYSSMINRSPYIRDIVDDRIHISYKNRSNRIEKILNTLLPAIFIRKVSREKLEAQLEEKLEATKVMILLSKAGLTINETVFIKILSLTKKEKLLANENKPKNSVGLYLLCRMFFFHGKLDEVNQDLILSKFNNIQSKWNTLLSDYKITEASAKLYPDELSIVASDAFNKLNIQFKWNFPYLSSHSISKRPILMAIENSDDIILTQNIITLLELERIWVADLSPHIQFFITQLTPNHLKKVTSTAESFATIAHDLYQSNWMNRDLFVRNIAYIFASLAESMIDEAPSVANLMKEEAEKYTAQERSLLWEKGVVKWTLEAVQEVVAFNKDVAVYNEAVKRYESPMAYRHTLFWQTLNIARIQTNNATPIRNMTSNWNYGYSAQLCLSAAMMLGLIISVGFILSNMQSSYDSQYSPDGEQTNILNNPIR